MDLRGPKLFFIGFILLALYGTAFSSFCTREYEGKKPCRKTFDSLKFIGIVFTYSSTCPENRTEKACCTGYTGENCSELTNACKEEEKCAGHMCTEQYTEGCMCKKEEKINEAFMGKDTRTILVQCEFPCERKGCCNGYKGDECNEVIKSAFLSEKEMDNIREQLKIDEGYKDVIYIDSEGYPTFGIGHLIRKTDEEHRKPVGTKVSEERIRAVFKADVHIATTEVKVLFPKACSFPGEVKEILVNMIFNLGRPRLKKFKKFVAAVNARNWTTAAAEMIDSKWYRQVGDRAKRLVKRMKAVPQSDDQGDLNGTCEVIKSAFLSEKEMDNIREQLKIDEGYKDVIYIDSEGYPTFGIGHLIRKTDEEHGKPVGTKVSEERIRAVFKADVHIATTEVKVLFPKACSFPGEVKEILVNMIFNLGRPRLKKFKKFVAAVNARNWTTAAAEMIDSKWYRQVGDRAKRLVKRMKAVEDCSSIG